MFFPLSALLICNRSGELLLVFGEDKIIAPTSLASATFPFPACTARLGFRDAIAIPSVVPLHVFLKVHLELSVGFRGAGDACEGIISAAWAELFVHIFHGKEAGVAALDEGFKVSDTLQGSRGQKVQVHLQEDILTLIQLASGYVLWSLETYGKISSHGCDLHRFRLW